MSRYFSLLITADIQKDTFRSQLDASREHCNKMKTSTWNGFYKDAARNGRYFSIFFKPCGGTGLRCKMRLKKLEDRIIFENVKKKKTNSWPFFLAAAALAIQPPRCSAQRCV
jgi:hypothetical protein